jgi:hypothetical protein
MKQQTKIRAKTHDVAFGFRMGAGFQGDVNRSHPVSIEPNLTSDINPPTSYGQAVLVSTIDQGMRAFAAGDVALTQAYGITVRPYPVQQSSGSNFGAAAIGAAVPASGIIDVVRFGYIMVTLPVGQVPVKNGQAVVWGAASSGIHIQGGFEAAASAGNTATLANAHFNGAPDANGNVELMFNI